MTPGARIAAAIEVLDAIADGAAAEQALTRWARQSRFAGSKDRAAVRDHVFDALRRYRSAQARGGGASGRAIMIGLLREDGINLDDMFNGVGHAPAPLTEAERASGTTEISPGAQWNLPEWLLPHWRDSLGPHAESAALQSQARAPVTLRVNLQRGDVQSAMAQLAAEQIVTEANPLSATALTVIDGARRIRQSDSFQSGLVELQDAASQAVIDRLPVVARALDYCAGGGGKALAMAARGMTVAAHDIDPARMRDLPERAARAGTTVERMTSAEAERAAPFDLVLCDAPCSGSGAWRRSPHGKWLLTAERLAELTRIQDDVLRKARDLAAPGGVLAYATCSVLRCENEDRVSAFLAQNPEWRCTFQHRLDLSQHGDGFFTAHLTRVKK